MFAFASVRRRVRYLPIPKNASTSIKIALLQADGIRKPPHAADEWMHFHSHFYAIPDDFVPLVTFSVVRHPLRRLVSAYHEKLRTGKARQLDGRAPDPSATFDEWVDFCTSLPPHKTNAHWCPQSRLLRNCGVSLTLIVHLESLAVFWRSVMHRAYRLPHLIHGHRCGLDHPIPRISQVTKKKIEDYYWDDFGYGYDFLPRE